MRTTLALLIAARLRDLAERLERHAVPEATRADIWRNITDRLADTWQAANDSLDDMAGVEPGSDQLTRAQVDAFKRSAPHHTGWRDAR